MAINLTDLDADVVEAISEYSVAFVIEGVTYSGYTDPPENNPELMVGGDHDRYAFRLYARKADFTLLPNKRAEVTMDGKRYEIDSIESSPMSPIIEIGLEEVT